MQIFKLSLLLLSMLFSLYSCKKSPSFEGKYKDEPLTSANYKVELISIELLKFAFPKSAYTSNDNGTGPDLYFQIERIDRNVGELPFSTYDQVFVDMVAADLPYKFVLTKPFLFVSKITVKESPNKQSFRDVGIRPSFNRNPIFVFDYDGPPVYSQLSVHNQSLTSFSMSNFVFKPGVNTVKTESGDAIIEYKITGL